MSGRARWLGTSHGALLSDHNRLIYGVLMRDGACDWDAGKPGSEACSRRPVWDEAFNRHAGQRWHSDDHQLCDTHEVVMFTLDAVVRRPAVV